MPASFIKGPIPVSITDLRVGGIAQFAILPYREKRMDQNTVRLIAGLLAVVLVVLVVMRRKKKKGADDEF